MSSNLTKQLPIVLFAEDFIEILAKKANMGNQFCRSILSRMNRGNKLTERQIKAVKSLYEQYLFEKANPELPLETVAAYPVEIGQKLQCKCLFGLFEKALLTGAQNPVLRFMELNIKLAPTNGRNEGYLYVYSNRAYQGKINPEGLFITTARTDLQTKSLLNELCNSPSEALVKHGKITGQCACCGRTLTNSISIERGIGPVCAELWGF